MNNNIPSLDDEAAFFHQLARLLAKAQSTPALLADLSSLLAIWKVDSYWLGHVEADGRLLVDYTSNQEMAAYLEALDLPWNLGSWAQGPTAKAIRSGKPSYITDWEDADSSLPFLPAVRRHGWRSSATLPIGDGDRVYALSLYSRTPGAFGRHQSQTQLEELANFLGAVFARDAELEEEKRKLTRLAFHDPLTDLPNRAALDLRLEEAPARAERHEHLLAVALFDLDDFKPVNDLYGHAAGDALLIELASRLKSALRQNDFACRLGGDEFVLLIEDLEDLDDLEILLDRLHQALIAPVRLDEQTEVTVDMSMGLVLYPLCFDCSSDATGQLLRAADQALYQAKAQKGHRSRWWTLFDASSPMDGRVSVEQEQDDAQSLPAYGPAARQVLERAQGLLAAALPAVVESVYRLLAGQPEAGRVIGALSPEEQSHHRARLGEHLRRLLDPKLDERAHRDLALALGREHAVTGMRPEWMVGTYGLIVERLLAGLPASAALLSILVRRLSVDQQAQLEGQAEVEVEYENTLQHIDAVAAQVGSFDELAEGCIEALYKLPGVVSVTLGRPDPQGRFVFEFVAGEAFMDYLERVHAGLAPQIEVTPGELGQGPSARAWRSGRIEHGINYATAPGLAPWRDLACEIGVRSLVAVPLTSNSSPQAVLSLYCDRPNGFSGREQIRFLHQLQHHFALALRRFELEEKSVLAEPVRRQWRERLEHHDGLILHYQPLVDLKSGALIGVEALARLRAPDGGIVMPGRFLPSYGDRELRRLFERGLYLAFEALHRWEEQGLKLSVSLNLPAQGLNDSRYLGMVEQALAQQAIDPARLKLEVLESDENLDVPARDRTLAGLKALGVWLVEDDLGSGFSSLLRLDRLPFDGVKIDQALVRHYLQNPLRALAFILHLTRLAQDMGKRVTVEGLESQGMIEASAFLGADYGQGYAIARPMPAEKVPDWVAARPPVTAAEMPGTALGALAVYLENGGGTPYIADRNRFLNEDDRLQSFCLGNNSVQAYIHALDEQDAPLLIEACEQLASLAARGVLDDKFDQARESLMQRLIERARQEG
ncbi:hypothetical protein BJI67_02070 [Acidihalobacter aeolianus]|uniref:Diguanylate cyclase DosC n=1 Tax=Acidihalobacter aeolianus TaxID=2792603 RepID=A0A1D8K4Y7_9GAMM|nr:EAL domain-containing protein [Acidihalobacter aeolianus]AOV16019.1 hypothetical protein BJI67_02070 [Acidihalobacter aeolianus]